MYLVSIILLLCYIGTKKKIVSFFTPHPAIVPTPPIISFWRNFQLPPPRIIPNPPIIPYSRVINIAPSTEFFCNCPVADF